jgi:CIC family chloride channel protein
VPADADSPRFDAPRFDAPGFDAPPEDDADARTGLLLLVALAVLGGAATGLLGGWFRWALLRADEWRTRALEAAGPGPVGRWLLAVGVVAACVAGARLLVRFAPEAAGSGVQRVEAHLRGQTGPPRGRVLPVKFVGGLLSIGSGMALGREGPTVQMGGVVGSTLARRGRLRPHDERTLTTSLAGAGLAVAFSAPLGGALFVLEEVAHAVRTRMVVATLAGVATAITVSGAVIGRRPDLPVAPPATGTGWTLAGFALLGAACGVLGPAYARLVVALLALMERLPRLGPEGRAAAVGAVVAVVGLADPRLVGGGDALTLTVLGGGLPVATLLLVLAVRWVLGPLCYSVGTPGGIFAPLLLVGAVLGALLADAGNAVLPGSPLAPASFGIVGMTAFFTAVVRAPVTGVVLIAEMTATTTLLLPMAAAAAAASLVCVLVRAQPIYDVLRTRMLAEQRGR